MAQSFEEFIQCINLSTDPESNQSLEDINNNLEKIYKAPNTFYFILQIYESNDPEITRFIPLAPKIFKKFLVYYLKQYEEPGTNPSLAISSTIYFEHLSQENPDIINYLTEMILENNNVNSWFCSNMWGLLFAVMLPQEVLNTIFTKMKELFEECSNDYENDEKLRKAFLLYSTISSKYLHPEMLHELQFEEFSCELFKNYFIPDNFEKKTLIQMTYSFIVEVTQIFKTFFDYFSEEEQCLNQYFEFIKYLRECKDDNVLTSPELTHLFQQIVKEIGDFILWIIKGTPQSYPELKSEFISKNFIKILDSLINTALNIVQSFPHDTNMLISQVILKTIGKIFQFYLNADPSGDELKLIEPFYENIIYLTYIYAELPPEINNQLIINPSVYYSNAYTQKIISEFDPRSFSFVVIKNFFRIDPLSTIQFVLNSELSSGLMFLMGVLTKQITKIQRKIGQSEEEDEEIFLPILTQEMFEDIGNKIQELLVNCDFEPDILILQSNSLLFLPEEQIHELINTSYEKLKNISDQGIENFASEQQFDFTIACKIVNSLLTFFESGEMFNSLQQHITIITEFALYCITNDAINSINKFFTQNKDMLIEKSDVIFELYLSVILNLTDNFHNDVELRENNENKIFESAADNINRIIKIKDAKINEDSFNEFLDCFFDSDHSIPNFFIDAIMECVAKYLPNGYEQYLASYLNFCMHTKLECFADYFANPFIYFITCNYNEFLNWEHRNDLIRFSLSSFSELLEDELKLDEINQSFEDSYYVGTLVSLLILSPDQLTKEEDENLLQFAIEKIQLNDDPILKYSCFNIITSVIHVLRCQVPDEIILCLLAFIEDGYVFRQSEIIRYTMALNETMDLYSPEIVDEIGAKLDVLFSGQFESKEEEMDETFLSFNIGINDKRPYGFVNDVVAGDDDHIE